MKKKEKEEEAQKHFFFWPGPVLPSQPVILITNRQTQFCSVHTIRFSL